MPGGDPGVETLLGFVLQALALCGLFILAAVLHWAARELVFL